MLDGRNYWDNWGRILMHNINVLVAGALGLTVLPGRSRDGVGIIVSVNGVSRPVDYVNDPRDYMELAIDNHIDIAFSRLGDHVGCECLGWRTAEWIPKEQTGLAVCQAFLMSKGVKF